MPNSPFQLCVLPFRKKRYGYFEYALFRRKNNQYWQNITCRGDDNELPIKVAKRGAFKEACIPIFTDYFLLKTISVMPSYFSTYSQYQQRDHYVIPIYYFAVDCTDIEIVLSNKLLEYKWVDYEHGEELLYCENNKTALWELNERLINDDLPLPL